jgi:hypothetical protein
MVSHPIKRTLDTFQKWKEKVSTTGDKSLIETQISSLKEIEESLSEYGTMGHKMKIFEKLISDPWMNSQPAFDQLYSSWKELKESYSKEIGGMTVNERLCHMGLMEEFERAAGSREKLSAVLYSAFLTKDNIEAIILKHTAQQSDNS